MGVAQTAVEFHGDTLYAYQGELEFVARDNTRVMVSNATIACGRDTCDYCVAEYEVTQTY